MDASLHVEEIADRRGLRRFVKFQFDLYRGVPLWVPPLIADEIDGLDSAKNPVFEFCQSRYWIATRNGKCVGRVAGFINQRDNELRQKACARFGYLDFIDSAKVCALLLTTVEDWARKQGMNRLEGPSGPGHFDRNAVLIEGFDRLPTAISSYNHPYYASHIEAQGFHKEIDYLEHRITIQDQPDPRIEKVCSYVLQKKNLRLWQAETRKKLLARGGEVFELVNQAYTGLHDFVPLTDRQIHFLVKHYLSYIKLEFIKIVLDDDDRIVAAGVAMKSISKALQAARGRLFPFGLIRFLRAMKHNDVLDLYLVAVHPDMRNMGLNAILMHEMHKSAIAAGLRWAETNGELDSNTQVLSMWKGYAFETHKRRRIYSKALPAGSSAPAE